VNVVECACDYISFRFLCSVIAPSQSQNGACWVAAELCVFAYPPVPYCVQVGPAMVAVWISVMCLILLFF